MLFKRYFLYLFRWQLSTPILAFCVTYFSRFGDIYSTIIANFIGGLIFFWIDRLIFTADLKEPLWSVKPDIVCADCGRKADRGYRLLLARNYDRRKDMHPEFRCEACSKRKSRELLDKGIELS